eukprot:CAMPEP_0178445616 /NCGR_PEP_ID=MMETSP0689_2-20121128/40284_1 /TAXON_ID=160604 /ORGANISM="Amphidinium massartii, Strain CS-259" /LENGTH=687 /DNA_ID=CAMNT_0020070223 /DNA_START=1 /DNA_END=2061 /DNA_ORIENTATION=+
MARDEIQDFTSMFSWLASMGLLSSIGMTALMVTAVPALNSRMQGQDASLSPLAVLSSLRLRDLAKASACLAAPGLTSLVGLALVYLGFPPLQPGFAWQPPSKRAKTCAKLRFSSQAAESKGPWDVLVVGSGMLAQLGYKVCVLEAHEVAGGSTHDYVVDGKTDWKFPSGLHYTIPASEPMLQVACGAATPPVRFGRMGDDSVKGDSAYDRVRLMRANEPELRIISDVDVKAELHRRFPGLKVQLDRTIRLSSVLLASFPLWSALHVLPWSLRRPLLTLLLPSAWWRYASRSAEEVFAELFADAPAEERENVIKLQAYLCGLWLDSGCAPHKVSFWMIAATGLGFPHEGGAYPEGGTGEMAAALVQSLEARDGVCFVRAPVTKILVDEGGRATGVEIAASLPKGSESMVQAETVRLNARHAVVSACGWRNTLRLCSDVRLPKDSELELQQGVGFVMANIGVRGSAAELGLECTNLELLPAGNGMSIFDGVRAYLADPLGVPHSEIPMMVTFPSVKDRARKGVSGAESVQLLAVAETAWFGELDKPEVGTASAPTWKQPERSSSYAALKKRWLDRLVALLLLCYPQLEGKLEMVDLSTPMTIEHYLPSGSGSAIGLDTAAGPGCRFTDFNTMRLLDMKTAVPGLWMTGQDTLMCGVPLAQAAGLLTAMRIAGPWGTLRFACRSIWLLTA